MMIIFNKLVILLIIINFLFFNLIYHLINLLMQFL